jgi:polar amino acid transport system substrate-binding protein
VIFIDGGVDAVREQRFRTRPTPVSRCWSLLLCLGLIGCDALPRDNAGALERASGGELRVGVVENPPWVRFDNQTITGLEPELIEAWAKSINARVFWQRGAESNLVEALDRRELDVVAAGFDTKTPYHSKLALSQPYVEVEDRRGAKKKHLLAVTPGESALLLSLDRFLAAQDRASLKERAEAQQQDASL